MGWVWNRSLDKLVDLDEDLILEDLEDIDDMPKKVDLLPAKLSEIRIQIFRQNLLSKSLIQSYGKIMRKTLSSMLTF